MDLSTQQLKGLVVREDLSPACHVKVEFDVDLPSYKTQKGVYTNNAEHEVQAPVVMWLDALDLLFKRLQEKEVDLKQLKGISGACQQHGSVFWNEKSTDKLAQLNSGATLKDQLEETFAWEMSPNWQDHSTAKECKQFEDAVGGAEELARISGSKAHHRFTGPQVLKLKNRRPELYEATSRIALVSSFLATVLAGKHAVHDIGDVCGMNLWDIEKAQWNEKLIGLLDDKQAVERLGPVSADGKSSNRSIGNVSRYFVDKYGVNSECAVIPCTGDNPGTILSLPLEPNDVIVSLGTSTTALVVTERYVPSSLYHLFAHPVSDGAYMGMLCYCNGALAREQVRDAINAKYNASDKTSWEKFNELTEKYSKNKDNATDSVKIGFYFPLSEIIPDAAPTLRRLTWSSDGSSVTEELDNWDVPDEDALRILESQALSIRYRLSPMLTTDGHRPRRIYYVGGASGNATICAAMSRVLVPLEGAYTLDLSDACATGAAYKAVYGVVDQGQSDWNAFIKAHWKGGRLVEGTQGIQDEYQNSVNLFVESEKKL